MAAAQEGCFIGEAGTQGEAFFDFRFLADASATLLGYFVHTWYVHYLSVIAANFRRLEEHGLIRSLTEATARGRAALFDFNALDVDKATYINGIYFYILSCHKNANYRLMNRNEGKQVLYLRGFDVEESVAAGGNLATGVSSMDATQFNWKLGELLGPHCTLFKALSPKDVYWETADAQHHFYGDFEGMIRLAGLPIRSIYVNALRWKEDVGHLFDRMDYFIVYVSSTTESALWELEQLSSEDRRARVTVVFDEEAIDNKKMHRGFEEQAQKDFGDRVIWSKHGSPIDLNVAQLREQLAQKFLVTTPAAFEREIEEHRRRIAQSAARLGPGARETWVDFHFHPALPEENLQELRDFSERIRAEIAAGSGEKGIACLPLYLNLVQLRIFLTLLMGDHAETGRALAAYAAVIRATLDDYSRAGQKRGELSEEARQRNFSLLEDHLGMAQHIGSRMLSYGKSHEFDNFSAFATAEFGAVFDRTKAAVEKFFEGVLARDSRRSGGAI